MLINQQQFIIEKLQSRKTVNLAGSFGSKKERINFTSNLEKENPN